MAKKVRFPLEMDNGAEARSMEELREHFSLARVLRYIESGKLSKWLRDRYEDEIADKIDSLDPDDQQLAKKVSEIFGVPYDEKAKEELEKAAERVARLEKLKQFTEEEQYAAVIDQIAFDQDELYDLLDEDAEQIYLCGARFSIPLSKPGVTYIGINNPVAVIDAKQEVDWEQKKITVEGVVFDEKYQAVLDRASAEKEELTGSAGSVKFGSYSDRSYLNFLIPQSEYAAVKRMYESAKAVLEGLNYDVDADVQNKKKLVHKYEVVGMATSFLNRL